MSWLGIFQKCFTLHSWMLPSEAGVGLPWDTFSSKFYSTLGVKRCAFISRFARHKPYWAQWTILSSNIAMISRSFTGCQKSLYVYRNTRVPAEPNCKGLRAERSASRLLCQPRVVSRRSKKREGKVWDRPTQELGYAEAKSPPTQWNIHYASGS